MIGVTHTGKPHADETTSTAILEEGGIITQVIRSRNPEDWAKADIVYDVGTQYDEKKWFDHHQPEPPLRADGMPYSSCGLIWKTFGRNFVLKRAPWLSPEDLERIHRHIDEQIMYGIDMADNGKAMGTTWDITRMVSSMALREGETWDDVFRRAVERIKEMLIEKVESDVQVVRDRVVVEEAFNNRSHPHLLILPQYYDWQSTLLNLDRDGEVLYTIFPDSYSNGYRISIVPVKNGSYDARKSLPESWAGKTPQELNNIIGITDAVFCHTARFIAGTGSREGIMRMAELAIAE